MNKDIPALLWIAIVSLGLMIIGKIVAAFFMNPLVLIDAALSGLLLFGIIKGHRWAYILTFVGVTTGTIFAFNNGAMSAARTFSADCLVLVPVILCTSYFFPKEPASAVPGN
ncbi:MAG: hypothetical protein KJ645_08900 [Planctomycetes bacterium]|nr:hypothetical protein [Planctomycetota bacterium]